MRGAFLKAMGLAAGWPDIIVVAPGPNVVGIELKTKAGTQTSNQRAISLAFKECRAWYILCRSLEDVERALRFCKVPLHARVSADRGGNI